MAPWKLLPAAVVSGTLRNQDEKPIFCLGVRQDEAVAANVSERFSMTGDAWHKKRFRTEVRNLKVLGAPTMTRTWANLD